MGPYNHANATIGRAYGLLSQNLQGGSVPGVTFMGSQGNSYTYNSVTFAENEERSPWEPLHVQKGFKPTDSTVSVFYGCRSTTFCLGLREKYWREHVRDMLAGIDGNSTPCLLLDPITAQQFIDRGGFDTKAEADPLHPRDRARCRPAATGTCSWCRTTSIRWATFGEEPMASWLKAKAARADPIFPEKRHQRGGGRRRGQRLLADHGREVPQDGLGRRRGGKSHPRFERSHARPRAGHPRLRAPFLGASSDRPGQARP